MSQSIIKTRWGNRCSICNKLITTDSTLLIIESFSDGAYADASFYCDDCAKREYGIPLK